MRAERQRKLLPDYLSYFILRRPWMFKSRPGGQQVFHGFPQSLQATAKTKPQIMTMTTSFLILSHYPSYNVILSNEHV